MAINNLKNSHFKEDKVQKVNLLLNDIEENIKDIVVNLSAEERKKYSRINEQNKLFVNRVHDFCKNEPNLQSPQVDWLEFEQDFESRKNIGYCIDRLESLIQGLKNAKILYDYDNYQDALTDYSYTNYMAGTSAPGFEAKQRELKQFFTHKTKKDKGNAPEKKPDTAEKKPEAPENPSEAEQ